MEYEFICKNCDKTFTVIFPMGKINDASVYCADCGSLHVIRKWYPNPVHFKGKGFTKSWDEKN